MVKAMAPKAPIGARRMIILIMPKITSGEAFNDVENQLALAAQTVQGKTKQDGEQQNLQNVAAGEGANDAARDHIQ